MSSVFNGNDGENRNGNDNDNYNDDNDNNNDNINDNDKMVNGFNVTNNSSTRDYSHPNDGKCKIIRYIFYANIQMPFTWYR